MNPLALLALWMVLGEADSHRSKPKRKEGSVMRLFNAFQIVGAFVASPFGIAWLAEQSFKGANVAFYAACAGYVVAFGAMIASVYHSMKSWN